MASDTPLAGSRFRLYRWETGSAVFMCVAKTITLTQSKEFDETQMPNCDAPTALMERYTIPRAKGWTLNFSGTLAAKHRAVLQADFDDPEAVDYQLVLDAEGGLAEGAGAYRGLIHIESLEFGMTDRGFVSVTVQARGTGDLPWTNAGS